MALIRATVVSVDRTNMYALVAPQFSATRPGSSPTQQGTLVRAKVRDAKWPPPLSTVWVDRISPSNWELRASISSRREMVHDDFFAAVDPAGFVQGQFGDTPWTLTNLVAYAYAQSGGVDTGQGVGDFVNNGAAGNVTALRKDGQVIQIEKDTATWFSARIATHTPTNSRIACGLGYADGLINLTAAGATDAQAAFVYDTADASAKLQVTAALTSSQLLVPFTPTALVFFDFDIVTCGDDGNAAGFSAMWVNGDGPYVINGPGSIIPPVGFAFGPFFSVQTANGVAKDIRVDWIHCETVSPVVNPDLLYS